MKPCKHNTPDIPICPNCAANRARMRKAYRRNSKKFKERSARWRANNKAAHLEQNARYYLNNKEDISAKRANRSEESRQKERDRVRKYDALNKKRKLARVAARRASKVGVSIGPKFALDDVLQSVGLTCYICQLDTVPDCHDIKLRPTIDHIIPIADGGAHALEQTAILHFSCNSAKGRKRFGPDNVPKQVREVCRKRIELYLKDLRQPRQDSNLHVPR